MLSRKSFLRRVKTRISKWFRPVWQYLCAGAITVIIGSASGIMPRVEVRSLSGQIPPEPSYRVYLPIVSRVTPSISDRVISYTLILPESLAATQPSWCTWDICYLSPRLYHAPLVDGGTLVGWTDSSDDGHISVISPAGVITSTHNFPGFSLRGLIAHVDGSYAVLLWDADAKAMWLSRRNPDGSQVWATNIDDPDTSFNPGIGDSRLVYGNGLYAAYFAVHGDSGWVQGHEGDQLTYVDDQGVIQTGGWMWGCSHSMAELVSYHPILDQLIPVCSSDCYASKGILIHNSKVVFQSDGNCGGYVSAQLGGMAVSENAWLLIFNGEETLNIAAEGIGLATIDSTWESSTVWLTDTGGEYERDPVIARIGSSLDSDRYLVGWRTTNDGAYWLGVIDSQGNFLEGPEDGSPTGIRWGNRDDSMRTRSDGSVSWVQGDAGGTTLVLHIFTD